MIFDAYGLPYASPSGIDAPPPGQDEQFGFGEILGLTKRDRIRAVLRALQIMTEPEKRWLMLHDGYEKFQTYVIPAFRDLWGVTLDGPTVREIFYRFEVGTRRREGHKWPVYQKTYEDRRKIERELSASESRLHEEPEIDDTPMVEHVHDGFIRQVDPRELAAKTGRMR